MGQIGTYLNGYAFNAKTWCTHGRPIIRIQNLTGSGADFNYFNGEIAERYIVKPGDLLFSWAATLGVYVWSGPEAVLNQHIFKVESAINKAFHRRLLEYALDEIAAQTHGTGMVHITKKKFDAIPVAIPPLAEQERIVEILEEHLSRLDAAIVGLRRTLEIAGDFARALLYAAATGKLSGFSEDQRTLPFDAVFEVVTKGIHKVPRRAYEESGPLPVIDQGDGLVGGFTNDEGAAFRGTLPVVLFGDHTRRVKFVDFPFAVGADGIKVLRPLENIDPRLAAYFLEAAEVRDNGYSRHFAELRNALFWVPAGDAQSPLLEVITSALARESRQREFVTRAEARALDLRRSLLHAAFTGRLTEDWREQHRG